MSFRGKPPSALQAKAPFLHRAEWDRKALEPKCSLGVLGMLGF